MGINFRRYDAGVTDRPCFVALSSAESGVWAPGWRHFGDIELLPSCDFTYLAPNVHDHLTWTEEIHRTHISSGSDDSTTGNNSPDFYEAMTTLAYLAGLVRSVRLGIACLVVPCRNPLLAAKQIACLDVFCKGRLDIGFGIGSPSTLKS